MTLLADPTRCPDCRAELGPAPVRCPSCGLPLGGETARRLFATLSTADGLLEALRRERDGARPAALATSRPDGASALLPRAAVPTGRTRRPRLSAATVPQVLLGLGALCLVVAALVFLAVAWSLLGVGGRTAVLLAATAATTAGAALAHRRGLRATAESLSAVVAGLLALDVAGARSAGWLGEAGTGWTTALVGAVLLVAGAAAATASRRGVAVTAPRGGPLVVPQGAAAVGAALAALGPSLERGTRPLDLALAAVALAALGWAADRVGLPLLRAAAVVLAGAWWLGLVLVGLGRFPTASFAALVEGGRAWPLAAAAGLAAAGALVHRLPHALRLLSAAAAVAVAALTVWLPAIDEPTATVLTATTALVAVLAVGSLAAPRRWAAAPLPAAVVAGLVPVTVVATLALRAVGTVTAVGPPWSQDAWVRLDPQLGDVPAALLVPAFLAVLLVLAAGLRTAGLAGLVRGAARPVAGVGVPAAAAVGLASYAVPLAALVALLVVTAVAGALLRRRADAQAATGGAVLAVALVAALPSAGLTALVLTAGLAGCVWARRLDGATSALARPLTAPVLAALAWTVGEVAGLDESLRGVPVLLLLAAVALRDADEPTDVAALLSGGVTTALAVGAVADDGRVLTSLAVHLTVAGALVTLHALVHPARRRVGWLGGALLAGATWARLADVGVAEPEAYTLPTALALVVVGLVQLRRTPGTATVRALGPGLLLATVPTLLVVLAEPVSWRAALLGPACVALVLLGARLRWAAPLVVGGSVGAVLALREAAPYAAAVPQWVLLAAAGAVLLGAGITWEQRVRDLRHAGAYLGALR